MKYFILAGLFIYLFFLQMISAKAEELSFDAKAHLFADRSGICLEDATPSCLQRVASEIAECETAGIAKCAVNYMYGRYAIKAGFRFLDTGCDGTREVVAEEYLDAFKHLKLLFNLNIDYSPQGWCVFR